MELIYGIVIVPVFVSKVTTRSEKTGMKVNCPSEEQVRARAYQLYQARGAHPGHEMDDWLQAEYELMQLPIRQIAAIDPRRAKKGASKLAIISLVQAAMILGAEAMPHLK